MLIDNKLLDSVSEKARISPRLRTKICLPQSTEDKVQRMFNAMEQGTIVPVHLHEKASETMLLVRVRLKVTLYDDKRHPILEAHGNLIVIHIPFMTWHEVEVLDEGSIMFEVKEGPFVPLKEEDILK